MRVLCIYCGATFSVPDSYIGKTVVCECCKKSFLINHRSIKSETSFGLCLVSFLLPIVGIVMGLIYLNKDGMEDQAKRFFFWAVVGMVVGTGGLLFVL